MLDRLEELGTGLGNSTWLSAVAGPFSRLYLGFSYVLLTAAVMYGKQFLIFCARRGRGLQQN